MLPTLLEPPIRMTQPVPNDVRLPQQALLGPSPSEAGDEIDLVQILDLLKANKWTIVKIVATCLFVGTFYFVFGTPTYKADGLVQVEDQQGASSAATSLFGDLGASLFGGTVQTQGEIQILQSRMVLQQVIDKMNLLVDVEPNYFPLVGKAIARWNRNHTPPVSAPWGLGSFAWGGELATVSTFEVPESYQEETFKLRTTGSGGYELFDPDGDRLGAGKVGEAFTAKLDDGPLRLFVRELVARPGTSFDLERRAPEQLLKEIDDHLDVSEQGKQSGVIQIGYSGDDRNQVITFIDNLEDAYLVQNVERRSEEAQQSLKFLEKQQPMLKESLDEAQARLDAYQTRHGTVDVTQETAGVLQQSVDLETARLELEQQKQDALQRFTPEHPVIKAIDDKLALLRDKQDSIRQSIEKLPSTQQDVLGLMRDVDVATQLYTALLSSIQQLQITKAGTTGNVRIVDRALEPFKRASPRALIVLPLSLLFGLALGCGFVLIQRALLRGVDDPAEVERLFGLATFGNIPYSTAQRKLAARMTRDKSFGTNYLLATTQDDDLVTEALRSLRTSLHFALLESPNNVLMITGPSPGLGKSFLSANLAAVIALSGKTAVVLDTDLRRGYLHQYFGADAHPGIADLIAGNADETAILRSTAVKGLGYVARGTAPPNPAELLMHERFAELIHSLSARFDYVILDAPPILAVTDAALIGRVAGSTLLMLKSAEHPVREIEESLKRLSQARVNVRGVIFNQVGLKAASHGHGDYGYRYYRYEKQQK